MSKRQTAREYKEEMQDLLNKTEELSQDIITRLYTLCDTYPDTPIGNVPTYIEVVSGSDNTILKAKSLISPNRSENYIKSLPFEKQIQYIAIIEKWLANQHPTYKQLEIHFNV